MKADLRAAVFARDTNCAVCTQQTSEQDAAHHRKLRSQGGEDSLENLVGLHHSCHQYVHANPAWSYDMGLMVHQWDDPAEVAILIKPGDAF